MSLRSHFFFPARIELGGSSVAVRAGYQVGVSFTTSLSSEEEEEEEEEEEGGGPGMSAAGSRTLLRV